MSRLTLAALLALANCSQRTPTDLAAAGSRTAAVPSATTHGSTGAAPVSSATAPPGETDPTCAALRAAFDTRRGAARGRCSGDADCRCHADIRIDNTMDAADHATAAELQRLVDEYRAHRCPTVWADVAYPGPCRARCSDSVCRVQP